MNAPYRHPYRARAAGTRRRRVEETGNLAGIDRLLGWGAGILAAFGVAAFTLLHIILPAMEAVAAAFRLSGSH